MIRDKYKVVGLMSGTSLDGLDLAYCQFWVEEGAWHFDLLHSRSVPYSEEMSSRLKQTVDLSALDLLLFHNEYGRWLGEQVSLFLKECDARPDLVASHGHTVFHQVDKQFTYQMGSGQELANTVGLPVVCDFRSLDVSLGGQGAPLVPIGDRLLFGEYGYCLNLGGIANVSFEKGGERIAFDNGMANMPLNYLTQLQGMAYDKGGQLARSGTMNAPLFEALNALDYYSLPIPKSLGYEWFLEYVIPLIAQYPQDLADQLCTLLHHVTYQIAASLKDFGKGKSHMLVTGGGAKNHFMIELLQGYLGQHTQVVIPEDTIIDFKEAIVFALMGVLRVREEINCLSSVTGAKIDTSSGYVFYPH
ncbi:MAG: anhydro-N-acetylmuramic acid kinase [Cyclobacteriaceae bacterium]|nr:anhydro-N-acetylmuramic acid kinase [Cyclobacteriaceae bacterium HetDA_MAG_MS6]